MSARARQAAEAAQRGGGGAGTDGRGRAMHGAIADDARAAKAHRNAWVLAALALLVYVGYIAWMFVRASAG
jgi:hypothetical protein